MTNPVTFHGIPIEPQRPDARYYHINTDYFLAAIARGEIYESPDGIFLYDGRRWTGQAMVDLEPAP